MASTEINTPVGGIPNAIHAASLTAVEKHQVAYDEADPEAKLRIDKALSELNVKDSNSVIYFGARAQEQLTSISENMLDGVRNKDTGRGA